MERDDFFEISETNNDHMLVLIIYDIVDNKKRTSLVKFLQSYGKRVQKSAFEAKLSFAQYNRLIQNIPKFCAKEDSIRVYKIVGNSRMTAWGTKVINDEDDIYLI